MKRHPLLPAPAAMPAAAVGAGSAPAFGSYAPTAQAAAPAAAPAAPALAPPVPGPEAAQSATGGGSLLPSLPDVNFSWSGYFEALAILCFVLALLWAVLWLFKRRGSGGLFASSTPSMRIESRLALGPKKWLMVVRYLDRRLVLGVTDKSIDLLTELYDQEFAHEAPSAPPAPPAPGGPTLSLAKKPARKLPPDRPDRPDRQDKPDISPRNGRAENVDDDFPDKHADKRPGKDVTLSFASLLKKDKDHPR